ncbi:hypothetical protein HELRODRAFT_180448 [Helobdella robusta]|uniref:Tyrosine-protein kinase ephrin type A/B receptor-like domain-containing protein n=1 Tax=Helobdella robusta TaxID=6412 RepID=T1FFX6_HELRO|nr:hypothetical protein HELRODRAFT_180448 [Helobdella robusta]ESN94021.1 hypothetical protein HELRODRAFT_180448 [Helobdella robusta]
METKRHVNKCFNQTDVQRIDPFKSYQYTLKLSVSMLNYKFYFLLCIILQRTAVESHQTLFESPDTPTLKTLAPFSPPFLEDQTPNSTQSLGFSTMLKRINLGRLFFAVFSIAQLGFNITFSFLVGNCSKNKLKEARLTIKKFICRPFEDQAFNYFCPYRFYIECNDWKPNTFYSIKNSQRLVIAEITAMKYVGEYSEKNCDINCSLIRMQHDLANNLYPLYRLRKELQDNFRRLSARYLPTQDMTSLLTPLFICLPGFILSYRMFCVPCEPGYYSVIHGHVHQCLPCPINTYQNEFGSISCHAMLNQKDIFEARNENYEARKEQLYTNFFVISTLCSLIVITSVGMWYV